MVSEIVGISVPEGRYVHITIKDRVIGIPKEHLPKIFDPYFTTKQTGSGLGLATAYSIIKKHNGFKGVIAKPYDIEQINRVIQDVLQK